MAYPAGKQGAVATVKRLSCLWGFHKWRYQRRHEVVAEIPGGWLCRIRHFHICEHCGLGKPGRIQITRNPADVYPHAQSAPNEVHCDRMELDTSYGCEEARAATGTHAGSRSSQKISLALEHQLSPSPKGAELLHLRKE